MHELAVTQSIVDAITARVGDARVRGVRLDVGALSGVVPDAVRFCFDVVAQDTPLEGARLDITLSAGSGRCRDCGRETELSDLIVLCPCGSADVAITGGRDLRIESVEVV
jgi:hydrogenase nickel incorporation protein HypA/HybF